MKLRFALAGLLLGLAPWWAPAQNPPQPTETAPAAPAKSDPAKEADIRRLIEATGGSKMMDQVMAGMFAQVKTVYLKSLPPGERSQKIADTLLKKIRARLKSDELLEQMIPLYDKYFSDEDIQEMTRFYQSPLGQKFLQVMPQLTTDSAAISSAWSQKVFQQIWQEMEQEFPELKHEEEPASEKP